MTGLTRRKVLGIGVAAGATGLAGCLDGLVASEDEPDDGDDTPDDDGDDTPDDDHDDTPDDDTSDDSDDEPEELSVVSVTVDTIETGCGSPDADDSTYERDGNVVDVSGVLTAPNPCHEAVANAEVDGNDLTVFVDPKAEDDVEICTDCIGEIEYEVTVELSSDDVDSVDVVHGSDTGSSSASGGVEDEDGAPSLESVETLDTACATENETADGTLDSGLVTVEGLVEASNPCHEVEVTDLRLDGQTLTVEVDVESTLDEGAACQDCIGQLEYEATISVDDDPVETLIVDHVPGDTHEVQLD